MFIRLTTTHGDIEYVNINTISRIIVHFDRATTVIYFTNELNQEYSETQFEIFELINSLK